MSESFKTPCRFFDTKNYPRGFSRHGDFTIREAQLLETFGCAFNELDMGTRSPKTAEEKSFLAVCRGEKAAMSDQEKVWVKYIERIKRPKRFHTLSGGKPQVDINDDFTESDE